MYSGFLGFFAAGRGGAKKRGLSSAYKVAKRECQRWHKGAMSSFLERYFRRSLSDLPLPNRIE